MLGGLVHLFITEKGCFLLKQQQMSASSLSLSLSPCLFLFKSQCAEAKWKVTLGSQQRIKHSGSLSRNMLAAFTKNTLASYSDCFGTILPSGCTSFGKVWGTVRPKSDTAGGKLGSFRPTKISILTNEPRRHFSTLYSRHRNKGHCWWRDSTRS